MTGTWGIGGGWAIILPWGGVIYPEVEPPVSAAAMPLDAFLLKAVTAAIGEADNEIGGLVLTRLTAAVAPGDTTFPVESTLGWPDEGKLALDGVVYHYTAKTNAEFSGITHILYGISQPGALNDHRADAAVADINRQRSAMELLRRSFFVNTAEGEDLSVLGRDLAVPRLPFLTGDDQYRAVIKAMAYNPRGSVFGIELALDALAGPGNWRIYEDLIRYPNTVFIYLPPDLFSQSSPVGRAYLNSLAWAPLSGAQDEIELDEEPITVISVRLKDLGEVFDFRNAIPSAVLYEYYPGATPGDAWTYAGSIAEGTAVAQIPGQHTAFTVVGAPGTVYYRMTGPQGARLVPESEVEVSTLVRVPAGATVTPGELRQLAIMVHDGEIRVCAGLDNPTELGLFDTEIGGFLGATVSLNRDQWYEVTLKKQGTRSVELWVDGAMISRVAYSAFAQVTPGHKIEFGFMGTPAVGMTSDYKQVAVALHTNTDYWGAREAGTADVNVAAPRRLDLNGGSSYVFTPGDVGRHFRVSGGSIVNPQGGYNTGDFVIDTLLSPSAVELAGEPHSGAEVDAGFPQRITLPDFEGFLYPDDLGKEITLSGSTLGNDGTYTITKILEPGTLVDLAGFDTIVPVRSNVCEVAGPVFVSETDLDYRIDPVFVTEVGLSWEQSAAGDLSGDLVSIRQALWANDLIMEIAYSMVLSAQILLDNTIENIVGPGPTYEYYPFYLSDLFEGIRGYLDDLTVAGVIPEYLIEE